MKKTALLIAAAVLLTGTVTAQDWKDALKKAATAAADKASGDKLTEHALVGTWNYESPGVRFEGEDAVSEIGGTVLETTVAERLEKVYLLLGIEPGFCSFTFGKEGAFSAVMGSRKLDGTYEFDAATHAVSLHFARGRFDLGSVQGHAYLSGEKLQLVFPATKLFDMLTGLGSKISSLAAISKLLDKYENVYIGFDFGK